MSGISPSVLSSFGPSWVPKIFDAASNSHLLKTFGPSGVLWKGVAQQPRLRHSGRPGSCIGSNAEGDKEHVSKASLCDTVSHQELATYSACVFDIGERLFGISLKKIAQSVWYVGTLQHAEDQRVVNTGKGTNEISEQNVAIVG